MRLRTDRGDRAIGLRLLALLAALLAMTTFLPSSQGQEGAVQRVHDPHIIREGDSYYIFSTGPGIPMRRSEDLFHWQVIGRVFAEVPQWARDAVPSVKSVWAPDISYFNGQFHLCYSISTFGRIRSCIGLATNKTLDPQSKDYRWVDHGKVIESRPGRDDWNAIDANLVLDPENHPWLAFGSFWSGIKLLALDPQSGKPLAPPASTLAIASRPGSKAIEGAFIVRKHAFYYLFVSFDLCGRGIDSTYRIMVGRSRDLKGPYRDRSGKAMMDGGGTLVLASHDHVRGPGHNSVLLDGKRDWLVHHYYDARASGVPTLQIRPLLWADDGWPLVGEPIAGPQTGQRPTRSDFHDAARLIPGRHAQRQPLSENRAMSFKGQVRGVVVVGQMTQASRSLTWMPLIPASNNSFAPSAST